MSYNWQPLNKGASLGPIQLNDDGSFTLPNGMTLDQTCSLENCMFGDARVDTTKGFLEIEAPDRTHRLKFDDGQWYYSTDEPQQQKKAGCMGLLVFCAISGGLLWGGLNLLT